MQLTVGNLVQMALRTVRNPREGATEVLSLGVPRNALWLILVLVVTISVMLAQLTNVLILSAGGVLLDGFLSNPVLTGMVQIGLLIVMVYAIYHIGRLMGGRGTFPEAILLVSWLQFIMVCLQVLQTGAMLVLPPVAGILGIIGFALFFWLLTNFVAVLHGFKSLAQVFVMIIASLFGIVFVLSIVLSVLGLGLPMGQI